MKDKIIEIVKKHSPKKFNFNIPYDELVKINLIDDLDYDSVNLARLIIDLEDEFEITFDVNELEFENIIGLNSLFLMIEGKV